MLGKCVLFVAVIAVFVTCSSAKVYKKCDFVKALKNAGVEKKNWGTWACIAKHESEFNTQAINHSSGDYGILQISSIYWCNNANTPGKGCKITCKSLLVDDITPSVKCARIVFNETQKGPSKNGFTAWTTYQYCKGDQSGYIKECKV